MKNNILILLLISSYSLVAGSGSNFGASFGGSLAGSMLGNALTQPRESRTQVVQVERAPAPRDDYDDSSARLRAKNKELQATVDDLEEEITTLKQQVKKLKAENKRLTEKIENHTCHSRAAKAA